MVFKRRLLFILICLLFIVQLLIAQSAENIQLTGFVNDYASIISPEHKYQIEEIFITKQ